jgi:small-conductance mechanosensitive channel
LRLFFALVLGLLLVRDGLAAELPPPSPEQKTVELPQQLSPGEARDLIARLSDDQVRALLIAQLDKVADRETAQSPERPADVLGRLRLGLREAPHRLTLFYAAIGEVPSIPAQLLGQVTEGGVVSAGLILTELILVFIVAWIVERLVRRVTRALRPATDEGAAFSKASRFGQLALHSLSDLVAVAIFSLAVFSMVFVVASDNEAQQLLCIDLLWAIVVVRLVGLLSRFVLAPAAASLRLVPLGDSAARAAYRRIMLVAVLIVANRLVSRVLIDFGFDADLVILLRFSGGVLIILALILMIWQAREPVAAWLRSQTVIGKQANGAVRKGFADYWHLFATGYVISILALAEGMRLVTGLTGEVGSLPTIESLSLLVVVPLADAALRSLVTRFFGVETPQDDSIPESRSESSELPNETSQSAAESLATAGSQGADATDGNVYAAIALRQGRILLTVIILFAFLRLWHIDVLSLAEGLIGTRLATALFDITLTVLLAYAVWSIVKAAVERHAAPATGPSPLEGEGEGGGAGATRVQTLLMIVKKFLSITLIVMVVLIALSSLGVNIGPLLAGAGVVGLAVGFGAQTLVRDIISGLFFMLDDAFRMGEYVDVGEVKGTVEKISVRSLRLRHHNGPLHTIPFGEIMHLTNYSRDWAIMKFELRIPFETDIDTVRKTIKTVGQEMMEDENFKPMLLGPLKSQGVNRMDDSALIIRCKFTAVPGKQFLLRREAFTRIQKAFEEQGIQFAPRRVLVEAVTPELATAAAGALDSTTEENAPSRTDDRG